jgi:hypothetical protein
MKNITKNFAIVTLSLLVFAGSVYSATTIGSNITTAGNLEVTGNATTTGMLYINDKINIGDHVTEYEASVYDLIPLRFYSNSSEDGSVHPNGYPAGVLIEHVGHTYGLAASTTAIADHDTTAIYGQVKGVTGASNPLVGLKAQASGAEGNELRGVSSYTQVPVNSTGYGAHSSVYGQDTSTTYGVFGGTTRGATNYAIYGYANDVSGYVYTPDSNNYGVYGESKVRASTNYGVYAKANGGLTATNYALYATALDGATNYAGYFTGAATTTVAVTTTSETQGGCLIMKDVAGATKYVTIADGNFVISDTDCRLGAAE